MLRMLAFLKNYYSLKFDWLNELKEKYIANNDMNRNTTEFPDSSELSNPEQKPENSISNSGTISPMVHCENLQTKRKRGYSGTAPILTETDLCARTFSASEAHRTQESNIPSLRKSHVLDRKELKALKMQIAMISDVDGDRPIHLAVVQENLKLAQKLCAIMLKAAISIDLTNYMRQTPLHLAVMLGNIEMIKLLLKCGSSLTLRDRNGNSVIHLAVKTEVKKDVLCLILSHPQAHSILNSMDHEGYTALHYAVQRGSKAAVTCLHRSGADMNVTDGKSGRTALMLAIMERNSDMVQHLLDCSSCIEIADYSGRTAFELALQLSDVNTLKLLENILVIEEPTTKASRDQAKETTTHHRTKKFKSI